MLQLSVDQRATRLAKNNVDIYLLNYQWVTYKTSSKMFLHIHLQVVRPSDELLILLTNSLLSSDLVFYQHLHSFNF